MSQIFNFADTSLKADKEFVLAVVRRHGYALRYADASLKADKDVVLAAVKKCGNALQFADASLKADMDVELATARWKSATSALKSVKKLKGISSWEYRENSLNLAVDLLAAFPRDKANVNQQLHALVEAMVMKAYRPGQKRDRDAFEADFE